MPSPPPASWYRRVDPLGPLFALLSVAVFRVHGYGGELTRDLALYSYSGQQVVDGVPPYVSVLNRAGPLAHLVPALGALIARVLGTDDVLTMRVVMTVLSVISVWLLYTVGRNIFHSRLAGAASAAALLVCQGFVIYATGGPREKTTMVFLVILALWAVTHRRWATAGVCVALATLTWQPAFWVGTAVAGVAMLALPRREMWRGIIRFCAAGLATTAVFLVGFALAGALDDFVQCFLVINARYTRQTELIGYLLSDPTDLWTGFGWTLWVLIAGLVASVVIAWQAFRHGDRHDHTTMTRAGLGAGTLISVVWSLAVAFNGWADAMFVVPLASLGLGGGAHLLAQRYAAERPRLPRNALVGFTVVALLLATYNSWQTSRHVFPQQRRQIEAVLAAAPAGYTIASVGAPQPLVLDRATNPNPYQMFLAGFDNYFEDNYPGGMQGISDLIASEKPTFITSDHPSWYGWMLPMLDRDYTRLGTSTDFVWYVRNDVGPAAIERLRQAVERTQ